MSPNFDSPYLWENSSPPLCVIHIQKRLDLLFHPVFPKFVLCCKNATQIVLKEKIQIFANWHYFVPNPHCKCSDFKILCLLVQFFV